MPDLADGERVTVQGSGANSYVLTRERQVYSCSCPAWRNMRLPILQRRCKHLVAYLNDTTLANVSVATRVSSAVVLPPAQPRIRIADDVAYDELPEQRRPREAALNDAVDLHIVLADKMEEVYGLRLPKEIAYAAGFYLGLRDDEKAELAKTVTRGLAGVGLWFAPGGLDFAGDMRLRDRLDDDPPEVVNVMYGAAGPAVEDARFGLVYDEPFELPSGVVYREAKMTSLRKPTLLETLRDAIGALGRDESDVQVTARRASSYAWINEVIRRATPEIEEGALGFQSVGWTRGSFTLPYVPGWSVTEDLVGVREHGERLRAYASGSPNVLEWIDRAIRDLADGSPGRALFLGRELHMCGTTVFRAQATELLVRAYVMLGRIPLVEITRAHHLALYPDVDLYEPPPPHAIVIANDPEDVAKAWELAPPNEADVEEAFKRASSVEVFDAIFDRVDEETRERVTKSALGRRLTQMLRLPAKAPDRARLAELVGRFIDRTAIDARSFERIVQANDNDLALRAANSVDLLSTSQGAGPLHIAARFARPVLVKALLERKADARSKNAKGRWPFDEAQAASAHSERSAHEVMLLLEAAGGGVGKVPSLVFSDAPPSWRIGDKVHHAKFGDGVVQTVGGVGEDTKLQIKFGTTRKDTQVKTLLGKFVERR